METPASDSQPKKIKVFVTYSWEGDEHNTQVLSFTDRLRQEGFEAVNDIMLLEKATSTDLQQMMYQQLTESTKVIVILSTGYVKKANAFQGGVGIEYRAILKDMETCPRKYILAAFEEYGEHLFPTGFRSREMVSLTSEENLKKLFRKLMDKPAFSPSPVGDKLPELETIPIPKFSFEVSKDIDVTNVDGDDDLQDHHIWNVPLAEDRLLTAIKSNIKEDVCEVIKDNSFLLYDIYERKQSAMPVFHEVHFGGFKADFAWLDDASSGPKWVLLHVAAPGVNVFEADGQASDYLLRLIDEVSSWSDYFENNPNEKQTVFGAVATFELKLVIGREEDWQTAHARKWRLNHLKKSNVEIRSYNTFKLSLQYIKTAPEVFYRFRQFSRTSPAESLANFWENYGYMQHWRNLLS